MTHVVDTLLEAEPEVNLALLRRINSAWPTRATIGPHLAAVQHAGESDAELSYDRDRPDYPERLLPFAHHERWKQLPTEQRSQVLTLAWIAYNERVISAEEEVANPTFRRIARGTIFGLVDDDIREAAQQSHVDETWHTYMHMLAIRKTRQLRNGLKEPVYPPSVTYRRLLAAHAETTHQWQRDILDFTWTVVSEISVNALLDLLSRDEEIQPMHSLIARLHARDESAHGTVMIEIAKAAWSVMDDAQRELFTTSLPQALSAFTDTDRSLWPAVLAACGVPDGEELLQESLADNPAARLLVRDFSGVRRLIAALQLDIGV